MTRSTLRLDRVTTSLLDARVTASGTVQDYAAADRRIDLALADGAAGQQALDWVRKRWELPAKAMPRAPLDLGAGKLQWSGGARGPILAQGTVGLAAKARAEFDLAWQPGALDLRRLSLKDADSDATAALKWTHAAAELAFKGKLDNRTLERILAPPPEVQGSLRGDFRASIDLDAPRRSTAAGTLEGEGLDILERWDLPVIVDRVRISVAGETLRIDDGALRIAGERLALSGTVERKPETFTIDARVNADSLDAGKLLDALPRGHRPTGAAWDLPVEGHVALRAKSVAYGEHVFHPVAGTLSLERNRVVADVADTYLCGFGLSGKAVFAPGTVAVIGRGQARDQDVGEAADCLARQNVAVTGRFDLDFDVAATGPTDALVDAATGNFRLVMRNGRVLKAPILARVLALDNVASLLRTRSEETMARGLDYSEFTATGTLEGARLRVERVTLDSPTLGVAGSGVIYLADGTVALRGIVAPFANVNAALRRIPFLGRAFGTRVAGIPFGVHGEMRNPIVVPLGPAAVGQSLVNLMTATFRLPIELLDPFLPTPADRP